MGGVAGLSEGEATRTKEGGEAVEREPAESEKSVAKGNRAGEEAAPVFPESADDEWMITLKGGHAVADKPVVR
jgi:hypothetical protein